IELIRAVGEHPLFGLGYVDQIRIVDILELQGLFVPLRLVPEREEVVVATLHLVEAMMDVPMQRLSIDPLTYHLHVGVNAVGGVRIDVNAIDYFPDWCELIVHISLKKSDEK